MASSQYPPVGSDSQNLLSIAEWLMAQGFSRAAAAGVAGTISGESGGNPESVGSGGNGLIGWTPPLPGIVTGNAQADFDKQLTDLLAYAEANSGAAQARGGVSLAQLKQATNPITAGQWWSAFEGPATPGSDERQATAQQIYNELAGYTPNSGWTQGGQSAAPSSTSSGGGGGLDFDFGSLFSWIPGMSAFNSIGSDADAIGAFVASFQSVSHFFHEMMMPSTWVRVGAGIAGAMLVLTGMAIIFKVDKGAEGIASVAMRAV
jgi:hypothetical protein